MVGRALHREVQGHLHPMVGAGGDEAAEIGERAELRMDGVVAAVRRADGVEAAGIAGVGGEGVVAALAVGAADRMDRGEIDHIEAERCDLGQARDAVVERAVAARNAALAARHHLVPGAGAGERPVGHQRHGGAAGEVGLLVGRGCGRNIVQQQPVERACVGVPTQLADQAGVGGVAGLEILQDLPPFQRFQADIEPGLALGQDVAPPGGENIGPGLDRIFVAARIGRREARGPAVVAVRLQGRAQPLAARSRPPQQIRPPARRCRREPDRPRR